jgi:3-oxoacyl-[acyl-carrier protein] reductase
MKKVIITGGNGGMALAIKEELLLHKYEVLNPSRFELNVIDEKNIEEFFGANNPDVLINCAGYIHPSKIEDTSLEHWRNHFDVNVTGAFLCSKYAIKNNCKIIINVGSTSSFKGRKEWGAYCASKAALASLSETLVEEGIDCYSLNPARTNTKMRNELFPKEDKNTLMNPKRLGEFVIKILNGDFDKNSHIVLKKDLHYFIGTAV